MRKKASIIRNNIEYLYTVVEKSNCIKITVYKESKVPHFIVYFSWGAETWGFNAYAPKTIAALIDFYEKEALNSTQKEFRVSECPKLFQRLVDCHFSDNPKEREWFVRKCKESSSYNKEEPL